MDCLVRAYRPGDAESVRRVMRAALRDVDPVLETIPDDPAETARAVVEAPEGVFLVAVREGTVVGTGALQPVAGLTEAVLGEAPAELLELKRMHVHPDHQQTGVGGTILEALLKRAERGRCEGLVLTTSDRQQAAHGFYESAGFELVDTQPVDLGGDPLEICLYRRPI